MTADPSLRLDSPWPINVDSTIVLALSIHTGAARGVASLQGGSFADKLLSIVPSSDVGR